MTRYALTFAIVLILTACAQVSPVPEPADIAAPAVAIAPAAAATAPVAAPVTSCNYGFTLKDGKCDFTGFGSGSSGKGTSWN